MLQLETVSRWKKVRLSGLFAENKEKNTDFSEQRAFQFYFGTIVPKAEYALTPDLIDTYRKYTVVRPGDIMINGLNLNYDFVTQRVGLVRENGIITSAYLSLRPRGAIRSEFYSYFLKAMDAHKLFHGLGTGIRLTLSYADLKNYPLPCPPREEQDQIVRFLDWKVSQINRLINLKRREIRELEALKWSMVSHSITRGLNPDVPVQFSGVPWLGDIPAHWQIVRLRRILRPVSVKNHPELPLLSVVRERGVILRDVEDTESNHNFIPDDLSGYKVVKKGQFVINKMKAWQGSYGVSDYTGIVSPAYFVFEIAFDNLEYFHYAIRSKVYVNFFAQASDGIRVGQWDLQMDRMKEIPFLVPPAEEQLAIVAEIQKTLPKYDAAIENLTAEVTALEEYKTALIADTVTGKLDIRGKEIPDFEFTDEDIAGQDEETSESGNAPPEEESPWAQ